ncbi:unnamed protein product [Angiostrongylus costaricensis]|uniref:Uncharacterized protein n=1 Tax=Angiostrongylus costaricensis TaxID=334426 RepID=A0A0R3PJG3_ANGCS|nr:unnamed protein product [Angiostrongylus costaricensis]
MKRWRSWQKNGLLPHREMLFLGIHTDSLKCAVSPETEPSEFSKLRPWHL